MNAALLLSIINSALGALPELLALYDQLKSGQAVTVAQVQAVLNQYQLDHAALTADIAAAKAAGN